MPVTRSVTKNDRRVSPSVQSETSIDSDAPTTSRRKRQDKHSAVRNLQNDDVLIVNPIHVMDNVDSDDNLLIDRDAQATPEAQEVVEEGSTVQLIESDDISRSVLSATPTLESLRQKDESATLTGTVRKHMAIDAPRLASVDRGMNELATAREAQFPPALQRVGGAASYAHDGERPPTIVKQNSVKPGLTDKEYARTVTGIHRTDVTDDSVVDEQFYSDVGEEAGELEGDVDFYLDNANNNTVRQPVVANREPELIAADVAFQAQEGELRRMIELREGQLERQRLQEIDLKRRLGRQGDELKKHKTEYRVRLTKAEDAAIHAYHESERILRENRRLRQEANKPVEPNLRQF